MSSKEIKYPKVNVSKEQAEQLRHIEVKIKARNRKIKTLKQDREELTTIKEKRANTKARKIAEATIEQLRGERKAITEKCGAFAIIDPAFICQPALDMIEKWKTDYDEAVEEFAAEVQSSGAEHAIHWKAAELVKLQELMRWGVELGHGIEALLEENGTLKDGMLLEEAVYIALSQAEKAMTKQVMTAGRWNSSSTNAIANELERAKTSVVADMLESWSGFKYHIHDIEYHAANMAAYRLLEEDEQS